MSAKDKVDAFNRRNAVGTRVRFWTGARNGPPKTGNTRSDAWLWGGHTPVVQITGHAGCVALEHVERDAG